MKKEKKRTEDDDDMRPEYDLSKLELVGHGIYAERFRRGTNVIQLVERDKDLDDNGGQDLMNSKVD